MTDAAVKKRVLLVEDDKAIQQLLAAMLQLEGYETLTADHGLKAIEILQKESVELFDRKTLCRSVAKGRDNIHRDVDHLSPIVAKSDLFTFGPFGPLSLHCIRAGKAEPSDRLMI